MIILHDYQEKAFNLLVEAFKTRFAALVAMATGLGKTIVAAFWAKSELQKKRKGLFLCHENGILEQAMQEFRKVLGGEAILVSFFGSNKNFDADKADIVFASFQTYINWKNAFFEDEFDFIIVDESHHGQAPTFKEVIQYFKPKKLLGITATPDRMDMQDIREIFGDEVVNYSLEESIASGWLTQVEYHILNDSLSHWKLKRIIADVLEKGQRVSVKQINETIFIKKRDEEIAQTIQSYVGTDKKTIIFCEKIEHAENFQQYLPNSLTYHSHIKGGDKENRRRLKAFREGSVQFILAVDKFNEGIDIPDAEVIVFLRCTDSKTIFFQQLGRGLRKILGKEKVIVLDFVANCERLTTVEDLALKTKSFAVNGFELTKDILHISGLSFDFIFTDELIDILTIIRRIKWRFIADFEELLMLYSEDNVLPATEALANLKNCYLWKSSGCSHVWRGSVRHRREKPDWFCPKCSNKSLSGFYAKSEFSGKNGLTLEQVHMPRDYPKQYWWICNDCKTEYEEYLWKKVIIEEVNVVGRSGNRCPRCRKRMAEQHYEGRRLYYSKSDYALTACYVLGIKSRKDYRKMRKMDLELPSDPVNWFRNRYFWEELKNSRSYFE
ncbi:MAG: DEAD/DEAH box helicase [Candidatus Moraniibacteriota bacterium]